MKKKSPGGTKKDIKTPVDWGLLVFGSILGISCMLADTERVKIITFVALSMVAVTYLWRNDPMGVGGGFH